MRTSLVCLLLLLTGCVAVRSYRTRSLAHHTHVTLASAQDYTHLVAQRHPECGAFDAQDHWVPVTNPNNPCPYLSRTVTAMTNLRDVIELYCGGTGACRSPGDAVVREALAKRVQADVQLYERAEADLRVVLP